MPTRLGAISEPLELQIGDHICWRYCSDAEHSRILRPYLLEGLDANDRIAYFGRDGSGAPVVDLLAQAGHDVEALLASGRLIVGAAEAAYKPNGRFDRQARLDEYARLVEETVRAGYTALRVAAETSWLLDDPVAQREWPAYELGAELLAARIPFIALCCYDARDPEQDLTPIGEMVHALTLNVSSGGSTFYAHRAPGGGLAVRGELDLCTPDARALLAAAAEQLSRPVIDLSELEFADVSGVRAIAALVREVAAGGERVQIAGASRTFRKMWDLLGMNEPVEVVFDS